MEYASGFNTGLATCWNNFFFRGRLDNILLVFGLSNSYYGGHTRGAGDLEQEFYDSFSAEFSSSSVCFFIDDAWGVIIAPDREHCYSYRPGEEDLWRPIKTLLSGGGLKGVGNRNQVRIGEFSGPEDGVSRMSTLTYLDVLASPILAEIKNDIF